MYYVAIFNTIFSLLLNKKLIKNIFIGRIRMSEKKVAVLGITVAVLVIAMVMIQVFYYQPTFDNLNSQIDTQQNQLDFKDSQISNLNSQINNLNSQIDTYNSQAADLNSQIDNLETQITILQSTKSSEVIQLENQVSNLQSQLLDATNLIADLHGPTGILPTYLDLDYVGTTLDNGNYFLELSVRNTETLPITQIHVTLNSVPIPMSFLYLNTIVNSASPLPSYQTATGRQDVTPPISHPGTYNLVIQAVTSNGTIYTYQTTIESHT